MDVDESGHAPTLASAPAGQAGFARMVPEAHLTETEHGLVPRGAGWFVVNARDARWYESAGLGTFTRFEGDARFEVFGVNVHVLRPGEPNSMYHAEEDQEDFLVLFGECILVIEGEERRLRAWDFVHCPPWTEHVFVGAGDGPCVILMVGGRRGRRLRYPAHPAARAHGAAVEHETEEPSEAYAAYGRPEPTKAPKGALP
jgi:uncharacterized cupin superfamily protein